MKRNLQLPFLLLILLLLTACSKKEDVTVLQAKSDHWNANMVVSFDDKGGVVNHVMETTFIYTGSEEKTNQKVTYQVVRESDNFAYEEFNAEFLPTKDNPFQRTLYSTDLLGNYAIGKKFKMIVIWNQSGSKVQEELLFEIVDKDH